MSALKKWLAFGSGVGVQIAGPRGAESLRIAAVRVRPSGASVAGTMTVEDFPHQPAGVWGAEYAAFLRKLGLRHAVATVILPRAAVIVRPLALPGVSNKDLDNAVRFQMDGLHPYNDDDVYSAWVRLPSTSTVLVAVARKDMVDRYAAPFEEAGIRVGGFTCSAAAIYSALRLFGAKPAPEILAVDDSAEARTGPAEPGSVVRASPLKELEYYGESPTRPVFSASFDPSDRGMTNERAAALAASELRIHSGAEPVPLASLLGLAPTHSSAASLSSAAALAPASAPPLDEAPPAASVDSSEADLLPTSAAASALMADSPASALLTAAALPAAHPSALAQPFAAALASACPFLSLSLNLLPADRRQAGSRLRWAPSLVFGTLVLVLAGVLAAFPSYENRKYLKSLQTQIAAVAPQAERAGAIDKQVDTLRRRIQLLDDLRRHPRADMDVLAELTRILPPPTWLNFMQISPKQVIVGGETPEAAPLVPLLDSSPLFEASEFQAPPSRVPPSDTLRAGGEAFRIKTNREGVK